MNSNLNLVILCPGPDFEILFDLFVIAAPVVVGIGFVAAIVKLAKEMKEK